MSQSDFGGIDPNTKSGTQLAVDLNGFRDAVNSGHSGATRPAYLPAGGHWVRVVSSTQWDLVFYDGSVDYTLRSVNPTTGQKIGIPAADLADKQTSANDNTAGRLLVNPAYGLGTTGALSLPSGTTANRPASPAQFDSRGNSTTGAPEWWSGSSWVPFSGIDYLNTVRIDVASAATVNLTTGAPNTRHINITGTTAITAFTVAAGQTYFVRFNAALTLTNNANIVTQSGANITTAAGDTCIIRATAANVVEVLSYNSWATKKNECTAWVNFNGTGTVAIRDSFNVSSITDNGTGDYTVNFATSMNNANYAESISAGTTAGANLLSYPAVTKTITQLRLRVSTTSPALTDADLVSAAFFGGK